MIPSASSWTGSKPTRGWKLPAHPAVLFAHMPRGAAHPGAAPELVEEYTYLDLRTDVGLTDRDFDPRNAAYSFGRF